MTCGGTGQKEADAHEERHAYVRDLAYTIVRRQEIPTTAEEYYARGEYLSEIAAEHGMSSSAFEFQCTGDRTERLGTELIDFVESLPENVFQAMVNATDWSLPTPWKPVPNVPAWISSPTIQDDLPFLLWGTRKGSHFVLLIFSGIIPAMSNLHTTFSFILKRIPSY